MICRLPAGTLVLGTAIAAVLTSSTTVAIHRERALGQRMAISSEPSGQSPASGVAAGDDVRASAVEPATLARASGSGLQVSLRLRQRTVAVGGLVEVDLRVDDNDGVPAEYVLDWGDGRARTNEPAARCDNAARVGRSAAQTAAATHWNNRVEYSYTRPGRYEVIYRMRTHGGCGGRAEAEEQVARDVISVLPGTVPTNGGRRPQAYVTTRSLASGSGIAVDVQGQDLDGWVSQLIVDFGDGTSARVVDNPQPCTARAGEWPSTPYLSHRFEAPYRVAGRFTISLTVFTTGCDGADSQQTTVRQAVVVPSSLG